VYFVLLIVFSAISLAWFFHLYTKLSKVANNYVKTNYTQQWQDYNNKAKLMKEKPNSIIFHSIRKGELSTLGDEVLQNYKKKHQYLTALLCLSPLLSSVLAQLIIYLSK
jgi:hypothetical protein